MGFCLDKAFDFRVDIMIVALSRTFLDCLPWKSLNISFKDFLSGGQYLSKSQRLWIQVSSSNLFVDLINSS